MEQDEATTYTRRSFLSRSLGAGAAATALPSSNPNWCAARERSACKRAWSAAADAARKQP